MINELFHLLLFAGEMNMLALLVAACLAVAAEGGHLGGPHYRAGYEHGHHDYDYKAHANKGYHGAVHDYPVHKVHVAPLYEPSTAEAPHYEAPYYEPPHYRAPHYESPSYHAPEYQPPYYRSPDYEPAHYEAPHYEASTYDAPHYEAASYKAPSYGVVHVPDYKPVHKDHSYHHDAYQVHHDKYWMNFPHRKTPTNELILFSFPTVWFICRIYR